MKSKDYFNAGVLFINYKKWIEEDHGHKIRQHSKNFNLNDISNDDQDILNSYLDGDFLNLQMWFNYPLIEDHFDKDKLKIFKNAFLVHYLGSKKPWNLKGIFSNTSSFYQDAFRKLELGRAHINLENETFSGIIKFLFINNYFKTNLSMSLNIILIYLKKSIL